MKRLVEIVGRDLGREVGPEEVKDLLAVHAVIRCQGQDLDDVPGLAQSPGGVVDGLVVQPDVEATQEVDADEVPP